MTTDRELLELAAKAAGIEYKIELEQYLVLTSDGGDTYYWNPLRSDGDALRLAVKLRMEVGNYGATKLAVATVIVAGSPGVIRAEEYYEEGDPYAATRRAIVRAAASIGKELK